MGLWRGAVAWGCGAGLWGGAVAWGCGVRRGCGADLGELRLLEVDLAEVAVGHERAGDVEAGGRRALHLALVQRTRASEPSRWRGRRAVGACMGGGWGRAWAAGPGMGGGAGHGQSVAGSLPRASRTANHGPRSPAGRETRVSHRAKCHGRSRGLLYGGPLRWASACARACPIADEENSQRPTFFLSMGGNLYFTCAAPRSAAVSCLRG